MIAATLAAAIGLFQPAPCDLGLPAGFEQAQRVQCGWVTVPLRQAMRFLTRATLVEVAGAAHGPMGVDDCTRGIAAGFLADPAQAPGLDCVAKREPIAFAGEGLDELLSPKPAVVADPK